MRPRPMRRAPTRAMRCTLPSDSSGCNVNANTLINSNPAIEITLTEKANGHVVANGEAKLKKVL